MVGDIMFDLDFGILDSWFWLDLYLDLGCVSPSAKTMKGTDYGWRY